MHETLYFPAGGGNLRDSWALARQLHKLIRELFWCTSRREPRHCRSTGTCCSLQLREFATSSARRSAPALRECNVDPKRAGSNTKPNVWHALIAPEIRVDLSPPGWDLRLSAAGNEDRHTWADFLPGVRSSPGSLPGSGSLRRIGARLAGGADRVAAAATAGGIARVCRRAG